MMNKLLIVRIVLFVLAAAILGFIVHQSQPNIKVSNIKTPDVTPKVAEVGALDAKVSTKSVPTPQPTPTPVAPVPIVVPPPALQPVVQPDYKTLVYNMESGNRTSAINASSGACGLGQALPCSKMPCTLSDYACQDTFFTNYMLRRYGTWAAAYSHELTYGWW